MARLTLKRSANPRARATWLRKLWIFVTTLPVGYYHIVFLGITQNPRDVGKALLQLLRVLKFAFVGIAVAVIGYGILFVMADVVGAPKWVAYLVEGALSVELNFLGSRYITWRDRRTDSGFWRSWKLFHAARGVTFVISQSLFNLQIWAFHAQPGFFDFTLRSVYPGVYYGHYLANTACIIVIMSFNFTANDEYVFARSRAEDGRQAGEGVDYTHMCSHAHAVGRAQAGEVTAVCPGVRVAIVVPCKGNDLGPTVRAILGQYYIKRHPGNVRLILVGNPDEPSWGTFGVDDPELRSLLRYLEVQVHWTPRRDANAKRLRGMVYALPWLRDYDLVWELDADVEPPPYLLDRYIDRIHIKGFAVAAGPVPSVKRVHKSFWQWFWDLFIDVAGGKTPYWTHAYELTRDTVGLNKMPVTANAAIRADVLRNVGGPAEDVVFSLEDYEHFMRILLAGYTILCDPALQALREHLVGFLDLIREYKRCGQGWVDYIVRHLRYNLPGTWRLVQLNAIPVGLAVLAYGVEWVPAVTLVLCLAIMLSRMLGTLLRARHLVGLVFPFFAWLFASCAVYGTTKQLRKYGRKKPPRPFIAPTFNVFSAGDIAQRYNMEGGRIYDTADITPSV